MISIVINMTENIDEFIENNAKAKDIFIYYLTFIPSILSLLAPLFLFISVIFFTSRLAARSEIIAAINGGISFYRLLVPYLVAAFLVAALFFMSNHYLLPRSNQFLLEFDQKYLNPDKVRSQVSNLHFQTGEDELVYVSTFNFRNNVGYKFQLEQFENKKITYKIRAKSLIWTDSTSTWTVKDYIERFLGEETERLQKGKEKEITIDLIPDDFRMLVDNREKLPTPELNKQIEREIRKGSDNVQFFRVEKHKRTAIPVSIIILTLIGVSIASRKSRGGIGIHLVIGLLISALYVLAMNFAETAAENSGISSAISVWIPNIIFSILALWLLFKAQK